VVTKFCQRAGRFWVDWSSVRKRTATPEQVHHSLQESNMYRVFLGAPLLSELPNDPSSYSWRTISSTSTGSMKFQSTSKNPIQLHPTQPVSNLLPLSTLEAASYRISLIYKDIVFGDELDEESLESLHLELEESEQYISGGVNSFQNIQPNTTNGPVQASVVQGVGTFFQPLLLYFYSFQ
jgi:hypothetical protein